MLERKRHLFLPLSDIEGSSFAEQAYPGVCGAPLAGLA